jgi:hypothetical protein
MRKIKKEKWIGECTIFIMRDTEEVFHISYTNEDTIKSFIIEDNTKIKISEIGWLNNSC